MEDRAGGQSSAKELHNGAPGTFAASGDEGARREAADRSTDEREALIRSVIRHLPRTMLYQIEAQPGRTRRFTYVSEAVTELFGCTPEEAMADPDFIYGRIVEEDRERLVQEEETALVGLTPFKSEFRLQTPSGQVLWAYAASAPRQRDDGTMVWDGIVLDITERKRIEAERERLLAEVREGERRNEFLSMLSHELRGPLAPIRNSLALLERTGEGEQARRALAVMNRQVSHLCRLVDDLLDVTRISRGKIRLDVERLELAELLRHALDDARADFEKHGIETRESLEGGPYWIEADRTRLAQIIGNLLSNAMKFTPRGGRVEIGLRREGSFVELRVRDTGVGLAPEAIEQLFQPFFQAEQSLARSRGGLGLGLALIKGLVELHGGTVDVFSAGEGQGAEFTVRLPLAPAGGDENSTPPPSTTS